MNTIAGGGAGHDERLALHQRLLSARPIPSMDRQNPGRTPIAVMVRLVWEFDGQECLDTLAWDWVDRDVLVDVPGPRLQVAAVWLAAGDLRRRV